MAANPTPDSSPAPRTLGAAADGMTAAPTPSRLLTTLAIIRAQGDLRRDFVALFEPFVLDRLRNWPVGEPVEPDAVAAAITAEFGIPSMPVNVVRILLRRDAAQQLLVKQQDEKSYVLADAACEVSDIGSERSQMLARMAELTDHLCAFARDRHGLDWDEATAAAALERFTEDFGAELALAKKRGLAVVDPRQDVALTVVYSFTREALARCPGDFDALEAMVQGTMIANTLYFKDAGSLSGRLPDLCVYFDTRILMRALGLSEKPLVEATRELLDMLKRFSVPMFVFPHTIEEMTYILNGVADGLRQRRPRANQSPSGRETSDALIRLGWNAGKIQEIADGLEQRLDEIGVRQKDAPGYSKSHDQQIDETRLDEILKQVIKHNDMARQKDVLSIAAIHRLRGTVRPSSLGQARAVFVTNNHRLVSGSRRFSNEQRLGTAIPHCMLDMDLSVQLWIRDPDRRPNLPRKLLIADCFAALNPSPEMWRRWTHNIEIACREGTITDEQVQNLLYNQQARAALFEITSGDPEAIDENTVPEVIARLEERIRTPLLQEVEQERDQSRQLAEANEQKDGELAAMRGELDGLRADLDRERDDRRKADRDRADRDRKLLGIGIAAVIATAWVALAATATLHGKATWGITATVALMAAAAAVAWGYRRSPWALSIRAVIGVGAFVALGFAVAAVAPGDDAHRPSRHAGHSPR